MQVLEFVELMRASAMFRLQMQSYGSFSVVCRLFVICFLLFFFFLFSFFSFFFITAPGYENNVHALMVSLAVCFLLPVIRVPCTNVGIFLLLLLSSYLFIECGVMVVLSSS